MEKYPRLRDETERILTSYLREQEQTCKEHVSERVGHMCAGYKVWQCIGPFIAMSALI